MKFAQALSRNAATTIAALCVASGLTSTAFGTLDPPTATAADDVRATRFRANWNAVAEAHSYRLDVATSQIFGSAHNDDFEDNDLSTWAQSTAGRWAATNDSPISGSISLHHIYDSSSNGHDQISYAMSDLDVTAADTTWRFQIRYEHDDP